VSFYISGEVEICVATHSTGKEILIVLLVFSDVGFFQVNGE
jgi:hypothetical protein